METVVVAVVALLVVAYGFTAVRLAHWQVAAPLAFTLAGFLLWVRVGGDVAYESEVVRLVAELTLVLILFHDASQVRLSQLRGDASLPSRLLLIGFPLAVAAGAAAALLLFPGIGAAAALLIGAALAPTDAGLGAATVLNPVVPVRVRRLLNVESGLNDGLATPVVLAAIAVVAGQEDLGPGLTVVSAGRQVVVGLLVGGVLGRLGARLLDLSRSRGWSNAESRSFAVLALAVLAWGAADVVGGNGFIAAFVAGLVFGSTLHLPGEAEEPEVFVERVSSLTGIAVWLLFGAVGVPLVVELFRWQYVVYAVLSLTVLRMVPVALSLVGAGMRWRTSLFLGWFGPRGMASLIFLLLAADELEPTPPLDDIAGVVTVTVLLSVVLHGLTAGPLSARYGRWADRVHAPIVMAPSTEPRSRRTTWIR